MFLPKIVQKSQKTGNGRFGELPDWISQNSQIFIILVVILAFLNNFWPNQSGSSPICDIQARWAMHVC